MGIILIIAAFWGSISLYMIIREPHKGWFLILGGSVAFVIAYFFMSIAAIKGALFAAGVVTGRIIEAVVNRIGLSNRFEYAPTNGSTTWPYWTIGVLVFIMGMILLIKGIMVIHKDVKNTKNKKPV